MKSIYNWDKATVFDIESDGLLREATKIHVLAFQMAGKALSSIKGDDTKRLKAFFQWHLDNKAPLVAHNATTYDIPLVEKLLSVDLSGIMLIDSLSLSWYLNFQRNRHGLGTFHEDYGIEKPEVDEDEWAGMPKNELDVIEYYERSCG